MTEDYPSYSGKMLERYFIQKLAESYEFRDIGSWWETGKEHYDIDVVALYLEGKRALVAEVKRQVGKFEQKVLHGRAEHLQNKALKGYLIERTCPECRLWGNPLPIIQNGKEALENYNTLL